MSKHVVARIAGSTAGFAALFIISMSRALAANDPGLGAGYGKPSVPVPPTSSTPFEVFGMAWQTALALGIALVAVVGLVYSVQHRRHAAGQHA